MATSGSYQTSLGGGYDTYLVKFTSSGNLLWGTYYGGGRTDIGYGVTTDVNNNVYITGMSQSGSGIATSGAYETYLDTSSYTAAAFIAKFTPSGSIVWGTYYGSGSSWGWAITTDIKSNPYITGYTENQYGIATKGAYQTKYAGSFDAFVAKFNSSGNLTWGTYYGGSGEDEGFGISADNNDNIYITGLTKSANGISTSGAYQTNFGGGADDAFVAKFNFFCNLNTKIIKGRDTVCAVAKALYIAQKDSGSAYVWSVIGGTISSGKNSDSVNIIWGSVDTGYVKVVETNSICKDSAIDTVIIHPLPLAEARANTSICKGDSIFIGSAAVSGDIYSWTSNPPGFTSTLAGASLTPTITTTYYLTETNFCGSKTDSAIITVNPLPIARTGSNQAICLGKNTTIGDTAMPGIAYSWSSSPAGFYDTLSNPFISPAVTTTYYLTETIISTGCRESGSVVITVLPLAQPNTSGNHAICIGNSTNIGAAAASGTSYSWRSNPSGINNTFSNPFVTPTITTTYYLTATNSCNRQTDSVVITVNPLPNAHWHANISFGKVTFLPDDTNAKSYLWYFGDSLSKNDSSLYKSPANTYKNNGTYKVKLIITNSSGCTNEYDSSILILNAEGYTRLYNLKVFPNPFINNINITYNLPVSQQVQIVLNDELGKFIAVIADEKQGPGNYTYTIDGDRYSLAAAVYFLHITAAGEAIEVKIVRVK